MSIFKIEESRRKEKLFGECCESFGHTWSSNGKVIVVNSKEHHD